MNSSTNIPLAESHIIISGGVDLSRFGFRAFPGSAEFMATYERALSGTRPKEVGANRTRPGTVNAAAVGYYQCLAFRQTAMGTQVLRRRILERFRADHGDKSIATLPPEFIRHMLDRMRPGAARNWLKTLRALLDFAVAEGFRADNPARSIKLAKMKTKHHRPWTDAELEQYERTHPIGSKARLAFALGLYTIQRAGDVCRMGRQHIRHNELMVRQEKTGAQLTLPIRAELQTVLDATPSGHMGAVVNMLVVILVRSSAPGAMMLGCRRIAFFMVCARLAARSLPIRAVAHIRSRRGRAI